MKGPLHLMLLDLSSSFLITRPLLFGSLSGTGLQSDYPRSGIPCALGANSLQPCLLWLLPHCQAFSPLIPLFTPFALWPFSPVSQSSFWNAFPLLAYLENCGPSFQVQLKCTSSGSLPQCSGRVRCSFSWAACCHLFTVIA